MPEAIGESRPYRLGPDGDFEGFATICSRKDTSTGASFDEVTFAMKWNHDSGGAYVIHYSYLPFGPSRLSNPSRITNEALVIVDGGVHDAMKDKKGLCLGGASQEMNSPEADLVLTPRKYQHNTTIAASRGFFAPKWKYVSHVGDAANETDAAFLRNNKNPIALVLDSHGNVDLWVGFEQDIVSNLRGNSSTVQSFAKAVAGKVHRITFTSCCTAKGKSAGKAINLIDSLDANIRAAGSGPVPVCGYSDMMYSWFRDGKFHIGHSKNDHEVCSR